MSNGLKDIANANNKRDEIMEELVKYTINIVESKGYQELNTVELNIYNVGILEREINKHGFEQYFKTTQGKYANELLDFLQDIEEFTLYHLLNQANRLFMQNMNEEDKMDAFTELDEEYFELEDEIWEFYGKCIKYVKNN